MNQRFSLSRLGIITAMAIVVMCYAVRGTSVTIVPKGAIRQGDSVTLTVSTTGILNWTRNGITISTCLIAVSFCAVSSYKNVLFSADSSKSISTMIITTADQGLNGGDYEIAGEQLTLIINCE